jgi:PKD repeat protein
MANRMRRTPFTLSLAFLIISFILLVLDLCRVFGQAGTLLDPTVGPQPATGFRVSVAVPPITAAFSFSPTSGASPLTVQFVDLTQGGPSAWGWNFGDGSATNTSQNPLYTFNGASNYTVYLTATGPGGTSTTSHTVTVTNLLPNIPDLVSLTNPPSVGNWTNGLTSYVSTVGNDGTFVRGDISHPGLTVEHVVDNSISGDTVSIAAGNYNVSNRVTLKKGMQINGAGVASTILTNWVLMHNAAFTPNSGSGCCFLLADNCTISNLWIVSSEAVVGGTDYQCGIGTSSPSVTSNDFGFTNSAISLRVLGDTDCVFVDTTNHCQLFSFGSRLKSTWDTAAINGNNANHDIRFYGGSMTNQGVNANGASSGGIFIGSTNTLVFCQNMSFYSDKAGYAGHLLQSPVEVFSSCTFDLPNTAQNWVIFEPTPGIKKATLVLLNCNMLDSQIANSFGGFVVRTNLP